MKFRTELIPSIAPLKIAHHDELVFMGSCFSESLGNILKEDKFKVCINPFGTLYDPLSIFKILTYAVAPQKAVFNYVERDGFSYVLEAHSELFAADRLTLENLLTSTLATLGDQLKSAKYLFITLGTAWVYKWLPQNSYVANCHKIPAAHFSKSILDIETIMHSFSQFHETMRIHNPDLRLIFTLSPVRHIKDGIENNQISKSLLRYCISKFCEFHNVTYFPSYELVMDDLRDYRFYHEDLIHPNELAVKYIWEKFSEVYFAENTKDLVRSWRKVQQSLLHRPLNPKSEAYQKHLRITLLQLENLSTQLDVIFEIEQLKSILN